MNYTHYRSFILRITMHTIDISYLEYEVL